MTTRGLKAGVATGAGWKACGWCLKAPVWKFPQCWRCVDGQGRAAVSTMMTTPDKVAYKSAATKLRVVVDALRKMERAVPARWESLLSSPWVGRTAVVAGRSKRSKSAEGQD